MNGYYQNANQQQTQTQQPPRNQPISCVTKTKKEVVVPSKPFDEKLVGACYDFLAHELGTDEEPLYSEVRRLDYNEPDPKKRMKSEFIRGKKEFIEWCRKHNGRENIYIAINQRKGKGKGNDDVISVKTICLDIDAKKRAEGFEKCPASEEELKPARKITDNIIVGMKKVGFKPPIEIATGNGYQLWCAIPKIKVDDLNREHVKEKLHLFQEIIWQEYDEDDSVDKIGDLARIIKVWGTYNIKGSATKERPHRLVTVLSKSIKRKEDKKLREGIISLKAQEIPVYDGEPVDDIDFQKLPPCVRNLLTVYEHKDARGWLRIVSYLASFFLSIKLSQEKATQIIQQWALRQPYREQGEEKEIFSIVTNIYSKGIWPPKCSVIRNEDSGFPCRGLKDIGVCTKEKICNRALHPVVVFKRLNEPQINASDPQEKIYNQALKLLEEQYFLTRQDNNETFFYEEGIYKHGGERIIARETQNDFKQSANNKAVSEVIGHIKRSTYTEPEEFEATPVTEICVLNGILNITTGEISEHTPEKIFLNKVLVNYESTADCPQIKKFLNEVLLEKDILVFQEFLGYCLYKGYPFAKIMLLIGSGRNGKSTLINLIKTFIGQMNCASVSLQSLDKNRFAIASLYGKLVNMYADIPSDKMTSTSNFKAITGNDLVTCERKFKDGFVFVNYAKLIFSANQVPQTPDDSDAFYRRILLVNCPNEFEKEYCDPNILDKLTTPEELSGLLNYALDGLKRLLMNGHFSENVSLEEVREEYLRKSNSTAAFFMDCMEISPDSFEQKKVLYSRYATYCKKQNYVPFSEKKFVELLRQEAEIYDYKATIDGVRVNCWRGIRYIFQENSSKTLDKVDEQQKIRENVKGVNHSSQLKLRGNVNKEEEKRCKKEEIGRVNLCGKLDTLDTPAVSEVYVDGSNNIYLNNVRVGRIYDGTFITKRTSQHYFRKHQGYGISKAILDFLTAQGIEKVRIVYQGKKTKFLTCNTKDCLESPIRHKDTSSGYEDEQCIIQEKNMVEVQT